LCSIWADVIEQDWEEMILSLQDLGALGEFLAAIATVITLIYLAKQIKTNSLVARSTLEHHINSRELDRRFKISQDPAFAYFLARDWAREALDQGERTQAAQYITMLVIEVREIFIQNKMGLVSGALLESRMVRLNMGIMGSDVARSVWATYRQIVEADFAEYFETRIFPDGIDEGLSAQHPQFKSKPEAGES
jgi:hypothetical protein